jgi:hypothetical protein
MQKNNIPYGITAKKAYRKVYEYVTTHPKECPQDCDKPEYFAKMNSLIEALPTPEDATIADIKQVMIEVIAGTFEGYYYSDSDGNYSMSAYAKLFWQGLSVNEAELADLKNKKFYELCLHPLKTTADFREHAKWANDNDQEREEWIKSELERWLPRLKAKYGEVAVVDSDLGPIFGEDTLLRTGTCPIWFCTDEYSYLPFLEFLTRYDYKMDTNKLEKEILDMDLEPMIG